MEIESVKNRIYDEIMNLVCCISDELPVSATHEQIYLVYHLVGSSRRIDAVCYNANIAWSRYVDFQQCDNLYSYHILAVDFCVSLVEDSLNRQFSANPDYKSFEN